jgi:hypothetical protein
MITTASEELTQLDFEVILSEDDKTVYVKLSGFENLADADDYASFLNKALPLMLFESEVIH